jgi:hypothetical protein
VVAMLRPFNRAVPGLSPGAGSPAGSPAAPFRLPSGSLVALARAPHPGRHRCGLGGCRRTGRRRVASGRCCAGWKLMKHPQLVTTSSAGRPPIQHRVRDDIVGQFYGEPVPRTRHDRRPNGRPRRRAAGHGCEPVVPRTSGEHVVTDRVRLAVSGTGGAPSGRGDGDGRWDQRCGASAGPVVASWAVRATTGLALL